MSLSEFHEAARSGDLSKARELLSQGDPGYVDCVDSRGQTPLLLASREGHLEMVRMLITEFHANTAGQDDSGCTALMVAARAGHDEVVKSLLTDPNVPIYVTDKKGQAVLHHACAGGSISVLKALIEESKATINFIDNHNDMPLHVAAYNGNSRIVLGLVKEFNCRDINARGHLGRTVLHIACSMGNVNLVKALISKHNADIYARDAEFNPPLHVAALYGQEDVVVTLLEDFGVDHGTRGHRGRTLLHSACGGGNVSLVQTIIRKYKGNTNQFDNLHHRTPIHVAAEYGRKEVVMMLIEEFGVNISSEPNTGLFHHRTYHARRCLVCSACTGRNVRLVEALLLKEYSLNINDAPLEAVYDMLLMLLDTYDSDPKDKENWNENSACIGHLIHILFSQSVSSLNYQSQTLLDVISNKQKELVSTLIRCNFCVKACPELQKTLFHIACSWGDLHLIKTLLSDYNIDVGTKNDQNNTPLHEAALGGAKEVSLLLTEFLGTVSRGHLGRTALHFACSGGNVDLVRALILEHKADILARDDRDNSPLHVAALSGREEVVSILVSEFNCDVDERGYLGRSLLHSACCGGNVSLVMYLVHKYKMNVSARDNQNDMPIHAAVSCAQKEVLSVLLDEFGCDPNAKGHEGMTPLHHACKCGYIVLVQTLVARHGVDLTAQDDLGNTPIHTAALYGQEQVVTIWLSLSKNYLSIRGHLGRSVLHSACSMGNIKLVKALTAQHGAYVHRCDDNNHTALDVAVLYGHIMIAKYLIENYFFCNTTLLHTACSVGNSVVVKTLLLEEKPSLSSDDQGNILLRTAALGGHQEVCTLLIDEYGCDPNVKDNFGWSLLHHACTNGNVSLIRTLLVQYKADVEVKDDSNDTPLHVAAKWGHENAVMMLIDEFQGDINARGHLGRNVLHCACISTNISLVLALCKVYYAAINVCDDEGNTPLHVAALAGKESLVMTLLSNFECDLNIRGHDGRVLLHSACISGNIDLVCSLTNYLKEAVNARDDHNNTPLHVAALHGQGKVLIVLLNDFKCDPNIRGYVGRSLLHSACINGDVDLVCSFINYLKEEIDFSARDDQNNTPLHVAAMHGKQDAVETLIKKFGCDPQVKGREDKSLLHLACMGGNADLVHYVCKYIPVLAVDSNGDTPLHVAASSGYTECMEILLDQNAPILMRNRSGSTPIDVAKDNAKDLLLQYIVRNRSKIYQKYDVIKKISKAKYSGAARITRVFVIGNPGAGKSSIIETLKREARLDYFKRVSKSSVPPHTTGIIPSIYTSKNYGRVLFYDFAGDPEYYSSHAAILETFATSKKGDNIFIIVVNLKEESATINRIITYWILFVKNQNFFTEKSFFYIAGSHLDSLRWTEKRSKTRQFKAICAKAMEANNAISYTMLNCCRPRSTSVRALQRQIRNWTEHSPCYELSVEASILLGLLEKDFKHVISCSITSLLEYIKDTNIALPRKKQDLLPTLTELQDIGILFVVTGNDTVMLNISKFTQEVHQRLFSKESIKKITENKSFNTGVIPQDLLFTNTQNSTNEYILPEYVNKECLVQLQYCQEIFHEDIKAFLPESTYCDQSFLFFPALCTAEKEEIVLWNNPAHVKYKIGWLAQCSSETGDYFPPRFLHVLLLRLVFKFTLSIKTATESSSEHSVFQRRCRMWSTGVFWSMIQGVMCIVELVDQSKSILVLAKSDNETPENFTKYFNAVIDCIKVTMSDFCSKIHPNFYLLDTTSEADYINPVPRANEDSYFNPDHMFKVSEVEKVLAHPEGEVVHSVSDNNKMRVSELQILFPKQSQLFYEASSDYSDYDCCVSSLPPAVTPLLECQIDKDNDVETDLRTIAHHILDWNSTLAAHLKLSEVDINDIQRRYNLDPELQRREALRRWKNRQMFNATYGNLLRVFVDAKHTRCVDVLCELLRKKCEDGLTSPSTSTDFSSYVSSLPPAVRPHLEYQLDWNSAGVDRDLNDIAHHMLDWEVKLSTHLKLTATDIADIKHKHSNEPELQRREALQKWKSIQMNRATYGNLLQVFVDAGHTQCADAVCNMLRKKCESCV